MKKLALFTMLLGSSFLYGCGETKPPAKTEKVETTTTEKKDDTTPTKTEEKTETKTETPPAEPPK